MMTTHIISIDSMGFWKGFLNRQSSHYYHSIPNSHEDNLESKIGKSVHVYDMKRQAWGRNSYQAKGCSSFSGSRLCGFTSAPSLFQIKVKENDGYFCLVVGDFPVSNIYSCK